MPRPMGRWGPQGPQAEQRKRFVKKMEAGKKRFDENEKKRFDVNKNESGKKTLPTFCRGH